MNIPATLTQTPGRRRSRNIPFTFLFLLLSVPGLWNNAALANWRLEPETSRLHFVSIKADQVGELHHFGNFEAYLEDQGEFSMTIDLTSVDTGIEIRDSRMKELFFEVANFESATLSGKWPVDKVKKLKPAHPLLTSLDGILELHGKRTEVRAEVIIQRLADKRLQITTVAPVLLTTSAFGLNANLEKLREIAGLPGISKVVPVTFTLTFRRDQQAVE